MPEPRQVLQQLSQALTELERERDYWRNRAVDLGASPDELREPTPVVAISTNGNGHVAVLDGLPPSVPGSSTDIRRLIRDMGEGFTIDELASAAKRKPADVRKVVDAMLASGALDRAGTVMQRPMFVFKKPENTGEPIPARQRPFDREPPVGVESMATGEPVRTSVRERDRRMRSTPGVAHRLRQKDKKYEEMQQLKMERAEAQRQKAKREAANPKKKARK